MSTCTCRHRSLIADLLGVISTPSTGIYCLGASRRLWENACGCTCREGDTEFGKSDPTITWHRRDVGAPRADPEICKLHDASGTIQCLSSAPLPGIHHLNCQQGNAQAIMWKYPIIYFRSALSTQGHGFPGKKKRKKNNTRLTTTTWAAGGILRNSIEVSQHGNQGFEVHIRLKIHPLPLRA